MFNLFPKKKSVNEIIEDSGLLNKIWEWTPTQTPSFLQAQNEIIDELMKEIKNLRHLKTENVELVERLHKEIQKKGLSFNKAELQIMQNDYKKCAEQRDEYHHQLNAANKEIEVLRSKLRNYQDKYAESFNHNDMNRLQKEIDDLKLMYKERESKLKTYNTSLLGQIAGLKEENLNLTDRVNEIDSDINRELTDQVFCLKNNYSVLKTKFNASNSQIEFLKKQNEKLNLQITALHKIIEGSKETIDKQKIKIVKLQDDIVDYVFNKSEEAKEVQTEKYYVCNHCGYKVAHDTNYWGGCGFCKDGLMIEKEETVQKHPIYPIHWGSLDSDIHEKAKNMSIEKAIKDIVKAEVENNDPFEGIPKSFPNEFQNEKTTAENLEKKFDKGEDVTDYFKNNIEKSWEEAASDLALRVVKLEKKIEELVTIKFTSDPNYKYFLEHGKWPYNNEAK
jgi:predicted  nucleic acid-binding Zn-ribbon protein